MINFTIYPSIFSVSKILASVILVSKTLKLFTNCTHFLYRKHFISFILQFSSSIDFFNVLYDFYFQFSSLTFVVNVFYRYFVVLLDSSYRSSVVDHFINFFYQFLISLNWKFSNEELLPSKLIFQLSLSL